LRIGRKERGKKKEQSGTTFMPPAIKEKKDTNEPFLWRTLAIDMHLDTEKR